MAPHSSTLAWKIPWREEPGGLQSMGSLRVRYDLATSLSLFTFMHWRRKLQPTLVFLPGESQGQGSLVGLLSMESHRVGHDWSDLAAAAAAVHAFPFYLMLVPCLVTGAFLPSSLSKIIRIKDEWKNNYTWQKIQNDNESESEICSVLSDCLWPQELYSPWNSPGQNTGVGSFSFLQGIFPTQGLNSDLRRCRQILYQLSHKGSPKMIIKHHNEIEYVPAALKTSFVQQPISSHMEISTRYNHTCIRYISYYTSVLLHSILHIRDFWHKVTIQYPLTVSPLP